MIYFLAVMLTFLFWSLCNIINDEIKKSNIEKKRKFNIPSEFWDDYNKTLFLIEKMQINEVSKVQYLVDDIIIKYYECLDYNTFTERISILVEKIESKKRGFLLNTQLN